MYGTYPKKHLYPIRLQRPFSAQFCSVFNSSTSNLSTGTMRLKKCSFNDRHTVDNSGCHETWLINDFDWCKGQEVVLDTLSFCMLTGRQIQIFPSYNKKKLVDYPLSAKKNKIFHLATLALHTLEFSPFLDGLRQIDLAKTDPHFADLVVLGEAIKVEDRKNQRLVHGFRVGHSLDETRSWSSLRNQAHDCWYLEDKCLVEDGIQGFPVHFGFELFLLVWQQVDFYVGIRSASHVQSGQVFSLDHRDGQAVLVKVVFQLQF